MKVKFTFDTSELKAKLRTAFKNGLTEFGQDLLTWSIEGSQRVPLKAPWDTGVLKHSAVAFVGNERVAVSGFPVQPRGSQKELGGFPRRTIPRQSKKDFLNTTVWYSTPYADKVHSQSLAGPNYPMNRRNPSRRNTASIDPMAMPGNQWLERHVKGDAPEFLNSLEKYLKRALA